MSNFRADYKNIKKLELPVTATDGLSDKITPHQFCEVQRVACSVCAPVQTVPLLSPRPNQLTLACLIVVQLHAEQAAPILGCQVPTVQQLLATTVVDNVRLVLADDVQVAEESMGVVWSTPVYDDAIPDIAPQAVDAVITTLFAPVAGAIRRNRYVHLSHGHWTPHTRVIATPLYVIEVISSVLLVKAPTVKTLSVPLQVCEKVRVAQGFVMPQFVDASKAIAILF